MPAVVAVAGSSKAGDVVRIVCIESLAVEAVGRGRVTGRVEARQVRRTTGDTIELLRAVDARALTALGNVHTDANGVARTEHVAVMPLRVLPLIEEISSSLRRSLHAAAGREVLKVVVGDIFSSRHRICSVESPLPHVLVGLIMLERIGIGHVLAPRASIASNGVRHDQLG